MQASVFHLAAPVLSSHGDSLAAEAEEAQIQRGLPAIEGMLPGMSDSARNAVYAKTIAAQRAAFIAEYGDAFGAERRTEKRTPAFGEAAMANNLVIIKTEVR